MLRFSLLISFFYTSVCFAQTFDIVPLGVYGGEREDNLSSYLISASNSNGFLALDAGTLNTGIRKAIEKKTFAEDEKSVLQNDIKGYFISHAHLDHISGLIINSPADSKKNVYTLASVKANILNHYFINETWINFSDEGLNPLDKYHFQVLNNKKPVSVLGTNLSVEAFPLSHGKNYQSSAVLIKLNENYALYFGDTGADRIENSINLENIWKTIAPLIKKTQLKVIMIEVSFPDSQPDKLLFGHLTPKLLNEELKKLASLTGEKNLKDLNIIVTHIKPTGNNEEIIKKELLENNPFNVHFIFPKQGEKLSF